MERSIKPSTLAKPPLAKWLLIQLAILLTVSAVLMVIDQTTSYSALLGGLIFIAPHAYFSRWAFRFSGARAARQVTHAFYVGETGKYVLTVLMFAAVFAFIKPLHGVAIFLAYFFMAVLNGFFAARWSRQRTADRP